MQHDAPLGVLLGVKREPVLVMVHYGSLGESDGSLARADRHVLEVHYLVHFLDKELLHLVP